MLEFVLNTFSTSSDVPKMALPRGADRNVKFSQVLHPCVAPFVKNTYKYPPDELSSPVKLPEQFKNDGIAHFAKLLVSAACIDQLMSVWNVNLGENQPVKLQTGCTITTSPEGCHFPGTEDRIICVRGDSFSEIAARAKDIVNAYVVSSTRVDDGKLGIRIAVPRRVVGTVIGKGGSHIQTLRHMTQATIHISPLFVTSEFACSERVISISSKDPIALQNATITLLSLINKHPERASCQRTFYKNGVATVSPALISRGREEDLAITAEDAVDIFQMYAA